MVKFLDTLASSMDRCRRGLAHYLGWPAWKPSSLGQRGEVAAADFLRRQGFRILEYSHRNRFGEIDLVALLDDCVVFVEVKTRRSRDHGHPASAVDARKQQRLTRAALAYLKRRKWLDRRSRFDVIAILWADMNSTPQIQHLPNAFPAAGSGQMYS